MLPALLALRFVTNVRSPEKKQAGCPYAQRVWFALEQNRVERGAARRPAPRARLDNKRRNIGSAGRSKNAWRSVPIWKHTTNSYQQC